MFSVLKEPCSDEQPNQEKQSHRIEEYRHPRKGAPFLAAEQRDTGKDKACNHRAHERVGCEDIDAKRAGITLGRGMNSRKSHNCHEER